MTACTSESSSSMHFKARRAGRTQPHAMQPAAAASAHLEPLAELAQGAGEALALGVQVRHKRLAYLRGRRRQGHGVSAPAGCLAQHSTWPGCALWPQTSAEGEGSAAGL